MEQPSRTVSGPLIAIVADELRRHAPFDRMSLEHLQWLAGEASIVYFPSGSTILEPGQGVPRHCYIVKQGAVAGFRPDQAATETPQWRVSPGECFPIGALVSVRAVTTVARAAGDAFCYRIGAKAFDELMEKSTPFRDFATRRLARLILDSRLAQRVDAASAARQPLERRLEDLVPGQATLCSPDESVRNVVSKMRSGRADSALIVDESHAALGIFTLRDLRDRVALEPARLEQAVGEVMTRNPTTLPADAMAFEAALLMAERGFRHVIVTREDRVIGVVSESELFAAQRIGMPALSAAIRSAPDVEVLRRAAEDVRTLTRGLGAEGMPAEQITRIVATLNDLITIRVIELECAAAAIDPSTFCWLAFGSEGRHEQTFATDQDNGLLFPDPPDGDGETVRQRLLPLARRVNASLAECGFPLCKGEIMAGNPRWCLSLSEWKKAFADWLRIPDGEALLHAAIFFDLRALHGAVELAADLRSWLADAAKDNGVFLRIMAENALGNEPPLGLLKDFSLAEHEGRPDTLDLKINGAAIFVDAARLLALAAGGTQAGTADRLRGVALARGFDQNETQAWLEAFHFVQQIRLNHQLRCIEDRRPPDNFVAPETLNALDRRILKESLRQARKLQTRLKLDYRL